MRAEPLQSVLVNYEAIIATLEEIVEEYKGNIEASSSARGLIAAKENFHLLFCITISYFLSLTLSKLLQKKDLSTIAAMKCVSVTMTGLKEFRSVTKFSEFWVQLTRKLSINDHISKGMMKLEVMIKLVVLLSKTLHLRVCAEGTTLKLLLLLEGLRVDTNTLHLPLCKNNYYWNQLLKVEYQVSFYRRLLIILLIILELSELHT